MTDDSRLKFVDAGRNRVVLDSGDESDVLNSTSQLSLEDQPPTQTPKKQAEVAKAKALALPPSKESDGL